MTHNELAKQHVRNMVGGVSGNVTDELIYRFEFPERPGVLMQFLTHVSPHWNISLFQYRSEGGDYGSVLVGIQVAKKTARSLRNLSQPWGIVIGMKPKTLRTNCF